MSWEDAIGFIISILAFVFLFFRNRLEVKKEQEDSQLIENILAEEEHPNILDEVPKRIEGTQNRLPAKPLKVHSKKNSSQKAFSRLETHQLQTALEKRHLQSSLESHRLKTEIERRHLSSSLAKDHENHEEIKRKRPRIVHMLRQLPHLRQLVIYHEILEKPRGLK